MSKHYTCELCKKEFNQKIDFTRHQNKKVPCITLTESKQISQTKEVKTEFKTNLSTENEVKHLLLEVEIDSISKKGYAEYLKDEDNEIYEDGVKTLEEVCNYEVEGTSSRRTPVYYDNPDNLWDSCRELNGWLSLHH